MSGPVYSYSSTESFAKPSRPNAHVRRRRLADAGDGADSGVINRTEPSSAASATCARRHPCKRETSEQLIRPGLVRRSA